MGRLIWKGPEVRAKVVTAASVGVDATMAACVREAKADHPAYPPASEPDTRFASRTGHEVGSIVIFEEAMWRSPERIGGQWGGDSDYSLFLEIGTSIQGPTAQARAIAADGDLSAVTPPIGPKMAPRPYLRPAADRQYPLLGVRIGQAFRGEQVLP
jgi:hypothetical protein